MAGGLNPRNIRSPLYATTSANAPGVQAAYPQSAKTDLPASVARREGLSPLQLAQAPTSLSRTAQDQAAAAPAGVSVAPALEAASEPNPYAGLYDEMAPTVRGAINDMPSALRAARDAELRRIEGERGIYGDEQAYLSTPTKDRSWGDFSAALLQPTTSGSFFEGLGNATAALNKSRSLRDQAEQARNEKLFASRRGLNNLIGAGEKARIDYTQDAMKLPGIALGANAELADLQLFAQPASTRGSTQGGAIGNGLTPNGDQALLADYQATPGKYAGVAGQRMVSDAYARVAEAQKLAAKGATKTPGQDALDKKFGQEIADWYSMGGESDYNKQLGQLRAAKNALTAKGEDGLSGWFVGSLPDTLGSMVAPKAIETREAVAEVVQRNLRQILGAQFTQKEGDALISRAYNPRLDEAENARRVGALLTQMEQALQTKQEAINYFEANGTLNGFQKRMPTMSDFDYAVENPDLVEQRQQGNTAGPAIDYTGLPQQVQQWRQQQLDGGVPAEEVDAVIRQRVLGQ